MIERSKDLARLLGGHDKGRYRLPEPVLRVRDAADRLAASPASEAPTGEFELRAGLVASTVNDLVAGATDHLPDVWEAMQTGKAAVASWQAQKEFRDEVAVALERRLDEVVQELTVPIIKSLRAALDGCLAVVRKAVPLLPEDVPRDALIDQPSSVVKAWRSCRDAADAYKAVWTAWLSLKISVADGVGDEFQVMRNRDEVWDRGVHHNLPPSQVPPWPGTQPEKLIFMVRRGADLWLPLPGEQEALWHRKYGERVKEIAAARRNAQAFGALLGG